MDGSGGEGTSRVVDDGFVRGEVEGKEGLDRGGVEEGHLGLQGSVEELLVDLGGVGHVLEEHDGEMAVG